MQYVPRIWVHGSSADSDVQPYEIEDLEAVMPEGWLEDEPATIPDPDAEKPEEWSDEDDGDWIAPSIPNPKVEGAPGSGPWIRPKKKNPEYKGKWYAPLIDNPLYKGIWGPRKIPNPDYFEDKNPYTLNPIAGVAFEWWTMQDNILVDNVRGRRNGDLRMADAFIADLHWTLREGRSGFRCFDFRCQEAYRGCS